MAILQQGQQFTDPAGRTGTVQYDSATGQKLSEGALTRSYLGADDSAYTTITPSVLQPATAITPVIPAETPIVDQGGGQAIIDANTKTLTPPAVTPDSSTELFNKYVAELKTATPSSSESLYGSLESKSGVGGFQTGANEAAQAESVAQQEFDAINAQIAGLNAEAQGVPAKIQQGAVGQGVTAGGVAPHQTAALRDISLRAIPLQYQGLMAQAKLAGAQRKTALAQSILTQAQNRLDRLFGFQLTDANSKYEARIKNIDAAYQFADKQEQTKLADKKATLASNNTQYNAFVNDIRTLSSSATSNGQSDVAAQIAQLAGTLDPNSKTFTADFKKVNDQLAALQGKIVVKKKLDTSDTFVEKPMTLNQIDTFRKAYGWTPPLGFSQTQLEKYIADNPNASQEELEAGARRVSQGTSTQIKTPNMATPDQIISFVTGNMNNAQKSALKKKADTAGISAWYLPASKDIANYLDSIRVQIQEALDAGYTQEEILAHLAS